jgi:hypothetical protein
MLSKVRFSRSLPSHLLRAPSCVDIFLPFAEYHLRGKNHHSAHLSLLFPENTSLQNHIRDDVILAVRFLSDTFPSLFSSGQDHRRGGLGHRYDCWEEKINSETPGQR